MAGLDLLKWWIKTGGTDCNSEHDNTGSDLYISTTLYKVLAEVLEQSQKTFVNYRYEVEW